MPINCYGQGLFEASVSSNKSIVRVWSDPLMVIYNQTGIDRQFILWDNGNAIGTAIDIPTSDVTINDFEIIDDEVWFCGVYKNTFYTGGSAGIIGHFNIPTMFEGSSDIEYALLNHWLPGPIPITDEELYIRGLTKIDVFRDPTFGIVAAMIGDVYLYHSAMYERVSVVSVHLLPNKWYVHSTFPKDGRKVFTDIAVLENMVVAAGHGLSNTHPITKTFRKTFDFPHYPYDIYSFDSINCFGFNPTGEVLACHVFDNVIALSQLDYNAGTFLHVFSFNTTTGHPQQYTDSRITRFSGCEITNCPWELDDLRYSTVSKKIFILERGLLYGETATNSLLWTFPLLYSGESTAFCQELLGLTQTSMDVEIDGYPVTSGIIDNSWTLDIQTFVGGGSFYPLITPEPIDPEQLDKCTYNTEDIIYKIPVLIEEESSDHVFICGEFPRLYYHPDIYEINFNPICY